MNRYRYSLEVNPFATGQVWQPHRGALMNLYLVIDEIGRQFVSVKFMDLSKRYTGGAMVLEKREVLRDSVVVDIIYE